MYYSRNMLNLHGKGIFAHEYLILAHENQTQKKIDEKEKYTVNVSVSRRKL